MLRRPAGLCIASCAAALLAPVPPGTAAAATAARHASVKVAFSGTRKMEFFAARQFGFLSRLSVAAPRVAAEWDYERNPSSLFPDHVCTASLVPAWWRCARCGNRFQMSPERRTVRGRGCPECEGRGGGDDDDDAGGGGGVARAITDKQRSAARSKSASKKAARASSKRAPAATTAAVAPSGERNRNLRPRPSRSTYDR